MLRNGRHCVDRHAGVWPSTNPQPPPQSPLELLEVMTRGLLVEGNGLLEVGPPLSPKLAPVGKPPSDPSHNRGALSEFDPSRSSRLARRRDSPLRWPSS